MSALAFSPTETSPSPASVADESARGSSPAPVPADVRIEPARDLHVEAIHRLIEVASRTTTVLPRSVASIQAHRSGFVVALLGDDVVGCGALHAMNSELVEVRSLVVDASVRSMGIGSRLGRALVEKARTEGFSRVFTLTDNPRFFVRLGFHPTDRATLPQKVWTDCIFCPKFDDCGETALEIEFGEP